MTEQRIEIIINQRIDLSSQPEIEISVAETIIYEVDDAAS